MGRIQTPFRNRHRLGVDLPATSTGAETAVARGKVDIPVRNVSIFKERLVAPHHRTPWVYDVEYDLSPQDFSWILPFAEEFSTEMDQRGALLVATVVPYGTTVEGHLDFLEDTLGIPNVRLHLQGLTTNDGSHLDRRSAAIVSEHFWQEFMSLEEVRKRLGYE